MRCSLCNYRIEIGDVYYDFDDAIVCDECVGDYLRDHKRVCDEDDELYDRPEAEPEYWEDR